MSSEDGTWMSATVIGVGLIAIGAVIFAVSAGIVATGALHSNHQLEEAVHVGGLVAAVLTILYGVIGVAVGIVNQSTASADEGHGDGHGDGHDEHAHHGSWSPVIIAFGVMLFLMGFILALGEGSYSVLLVAIVIILSGIANWWREDFGNDGHDEPISTGEPFGGLEIRKVGMWVFLMSEIMIFGSFFSSYLRLRMGWLTHWNATCDPYNGTNTHGAGTEALAYCNSPELVNQGYMVVASEFVGESFWTLLPGAINTFALILSSFTIVLALKNAGKVDWQVSENKLVRMWMPDQRRAVRNNLMATLVLGTMFLVLKIVEWNHLIYGAPNFTISNPDVALSASVFYVTTGAHGFHVFVGLLFLLFFTFKAQKGGWTPENKQSIEYFGLYWHFVDLAWVAIFPAFYLY